MADDADSSKSMEENSSSSSNTAGRGWGGWGGGWGVSAFAALSDLTKAAAVAADEISRTATAVAKSAISDFDGDHETVPKQREEDGLDDKDAPVSAEATEEEKQRKAALDRLENASEDSFLGHGLKVLDSKVENLASGAWQAVGNAWKGKANFVQKIETFQPGDFPGKATTLAPTLIESGKALTTKGMQVLERVGREAMDLLAAETGIEIEKDKHETDGDKLEEQYSEEVTFDRCFYIYGGPEQLEELEALSNHYALVCNRSKVKMPRDEKVSFDKILKQVQQIFTLNYESDEVHSDFKKGKSIENEELGDSTDIKKLCESSIRTAAEMASGFTATLGGLPLDEIAQKTTLRLEATRTEGVHRVAELCCLGISQLLMLGKSVLTANLKVQNDDDRESLKIVWPDDIISKAKFIRVKAESLTSNIEMVSNSFTTGISDILAAFQEAIKNTTKEREEANRVIQHESSIVTKAQSLTSDMESDGSTAVEKIQDALQHLTFVVFSTLQKAEA